MKTEACKICDQKHDSCKYANNCRTEIEINQNDGMKQIASFESCVNNIPLAIDPCRMCKHHSEAEGYEAYCHDCCWFYNSGFEAGGTE